MIMTIRRIRALSLVMALLMPAVANAQSSSGADGDLSTCSSKTILSKFIEFGKSGKMPPDLGKWLRDPEGQ